MCINAKFNNLKHIFQRFSTAILNLIQSIHYVKLYISRLCIPIVVFDFFAFPQILFFNMWVSISGINYEHHYWSKATLAVIVKVKSRMCCHSIGKSLLWSIFNFWVHFIFIFHLLCPLPFWGLPHFWNFLQGVPKKMTFCICFKSQKPRNRFLKCFSLLKTSIHV